MADLDLSVTEANHAPMKAAGIENKAGFEYGKIASSYPNSLTHTTGLRMRRPTAVSKPITLPATAPRVVSPLQNMAKKSTGKLTDAAIARTKPDKKAMFWDSKSNPSSTDKTPITIVAMRDIRISSLGVAWPLRITQA
ncbi:hypothetical protein D3C76_1351630 [compost metagenome]